MDTESKNQGNKDDYRLEIETPKTNRTVRGNEHRGTANFTAAIALQNVSEPEKSPEDDKDLLPSPPIDDDLNENMADDQSAERDDSN